ncbi:MULTISPECIES: type II toxin-antitoxin system RelE/ParE family toxin [unclassified Luteibacter]|uniref:type II toxin-antitoxin system RelE/ParE family toxin n=1 Tax=Luteibacter sp. PvP019 TaxID=3156436 RepID=UPI0033971424
MGRSEKPPANRLKPLRGDRTGQFSIRVNDQYRVCFVWRHGHAYEVTVVDYH